MRKFKDTHRKKRKYVRKHVNTTSYSLSRSWYVSFLPLLVIGVTLLTIIIVAQNFIGNAVPLNVTFQLPSVSFDGIGDGLQSIPMMISNAFLSLVVFCTTIATGIEMAFTTLWQGIVSLIGSIDLRPAVNFVIQTSVTLWSLLIVSIIQMVRFETALQAVPGVISVTFTTVLLQTFLVVAAIIYTAFTISYSFVMNTIFTIFAVLGNWAQVAGFYITVFVKGTLYFLGAPFRALGVLWEIIKPYVIVFLAHVRMALQDFQNGVNSLSSLTTIKP